MVLKNPSPTGQDRWRGYVKYIERSVNNIDFLYQVDPKVRFRVSEV